MGKPAADKREAILAILSDGPKFLSDLEGALGMTRANLRYHLVNMEAEGEIHSVGDNGQRRAYHLGPDLLATRSPFDRGYAIRREALGDGREIVRFGDTWKPGRGISHRLPASQGRASLWNLYG